MGARHLRHRRGAGRPRIVRVPGRPRSLRGISVHPGRDQVSRGALAARRNAARVPRVLPVGDALLLQPVAARRARRAARGIAGRRGARRVDRRSECRIAALHMAQRDAAQRRDDVAGPARRRAVVLRVPAPCRATVGTAFGLRRAERPVGLDVAGRHQRAFAVGQRRVSRRLRRCRAAAGAAVLARTGFLALRRQEVVGGIARLARRFHALRRGGQSHTPSRSSPTTGPGCSRSTCRRRYPRSRRARCPPTPECRCSPAISNCSCARR